MPINLNTWRPHGLILDPSLENIYQDAKISIDENGHETYHEDHATVHLFEDLFHLVSFKENNFRVNSKVPPPASENGREKACDLAIRFIDSDNDFDYRIFCFSGTGGADGYTYARIRSLEEQALEYCRLCLSPESVSDVVYACTLVGASIRCWSYNRGEEMLTSFWDGPRGDFVSYRDVGDDGNKDLLTKVFSLMKAVSVGAALP